MHKRLLVQSQLSNYDTRGKFLLECDSGWQMCIGRVREMLRLNHDLDITMMGPIVTGDKRQVMTHPHDINPDLWERYGDRGENRLHYFEHAIVPNALATRFDLNWTTLSNDLGLGAQKAGSMQKWDAVYINDPMQLRALKAMFFVVGGYRPRFYVHSHFIDNPECPKFPREASLWMGQCEAAICADYNFWQCRSAMDIFLESMGKMYRGEAVDHVMEKSQPWDDGYSSEEINLPINVGNLRFDPRMFEKWRVEGKQVIFVPNRIGGMGRSSDYTNCGKFMFEFLPELRKINTNFVVIAGNPNQKFFNHELDAMCGSNGYVNLVPDAFNRDEFKFVARNSNIAVGLYDQDSYGGTASRECIDLGCLPLWIDKFEYSSIAREAGYEDFLVSSDFSDIVEKATKLLAYRRGTVVQKRLQYVVKERCSYEATSAKSMIAMNLL